MVFMKYINKKMNMTKPKRKPQWADPRQQKEQTTLECYY